MEKRYGKRSEGRGQKKRGREKHKERGEVGAQDFDTLTYRWGKR